VQLRTKPATKKFHLKPEDKTQMAILDYCKLVYPKLHECVIKIHNEGQRSRSTNRILPRLGLRPGASDLFFAYPTKLFSGLFLEVKKDGWKFTKAQEEHIKRQQAFIDQMKSMGYMAEWAIGADMGIAILDVYMRTI
jgi:hypothetical protein